jgi:enoyl-CoA hydratase/carnithine racemase
VPGRGLLLARRLLPVERARERYPRSIADGPQIPIRIIKRLVYQSMRIDLPTHLDLVSSHMGLVRQIADRKEGVQAFKDKRPPKFTGR